MYLITCIPGTTVLQVSATDLDIRQNALITYHLGPGGENKFEINSTTGSLYILPNRSLVVDRLPTYYNITVIYCRLNVTAQVLG